MFVSALMGKMLSGSGALAFTDTQVEEVAFVPFVELVPLPPDPLPEQLVPPAAQPESFTSFINRPVLTSVAFPDESM